MKPIRCVDDLTATANLFVARRAASVLDREIVRGHAQDKREVLVFCSTDLVEGAVHFERLHWSLALPDRRPELVLELVDQVWELPEVRLLRTHATLAGVSLRLSITVEEKRTLPRPTGRFALLHRLLWPEAELAVTVSFKVFAKTGVSRGEAHESLRMAAS